MKKILLINPSMQPHWSKCQPYGLVMLAAVLEKRGFLVTIKDFNVEHLDYGSFADEVTALGPDWIGIGMVTIQAIEGYKIGNFLKVILPSAQLVYGGIHPTFLPEEPFRLGKADYVLKGECFLSFPELVNGANAVNIPDVYFEKEGTILKGNGNQETICLNDLPAPAYHLVENELYGMKISLEGYWDDPAVDYMTSLGCPFSCDFCASPAIYGRKVRFRSIPNVIKDLQSILNLGIHNIHFHDDDFLIKKDRVIDLCNSILEHRLEINWICLATVKTVLKRRELLPLMRKAGCVGIEIGIETGDEEALKLVTTKTSHSPNQHAKEASKLIYQAGIQPIFLMISYNLGEHIDSSYLSAKLLYEVKSGKEIKHIPKQEVQDHLLAGHFLTLDPGSALYNRRNDLDGLVLTDSWNHHVNERINFIPNTFLTDTPIYDYQLSDKEVRSLLNDYKANMQVWIPANFYLPHLIYEVFQNLDDYIDFALAVYRFVDGKRDVNGIYDLLRRDYSELELTVSAISLLSILRLVRSKNAATEYYTRRPSISKKIQETSYYSKKDNGKFFCSRPWTGFEVGEEDGVVRICCWALEGFGNVNEDSIRDIWNNEKIQETRRKMSQGDWQSICRPECPILKGHMLDDPPVKIVSETFYKNYLLNLQEIEERKLVLESLPRYWKAAHSTLCNLDCVMCYQDRNNKTTLPESFYSELTEFYPVMHELMLLGGEPFAIKRIRKVLSELPQDSFPDLAFSIITNGTIFDSKTIELIERVNLSWMLISVDAAHPKTYERIRRKGNLEKTIQGIKAWKALSLKKKFSLVLSFTIMKDNLTEILDFIKLSKENMLDCQFFLVNGEKGGQHDLDFNRLKYEVKTSLRYLKEKKLRSEMDIAWSTLSAIHETL